MTRLGLLLLADALLFLAAAPVPKSPPAPPPVLTREALAGGTWDYEYGGMANGWIVFGGDGTYEAQHHPGTDQYDCGTYAVAGNALILYESSRRAGADAPAQWRGVYRYDFGATRPPRLEGTSNGVTAVKLTRREPNPARPPADR